MYARQSCQISLFPPREFRKKSISIVFGANLIMCSIMTCMVDYKSVCLSPAIDLDSLAM